MLVRASPKVIALMQAKATELEAAARRENGKAALLRCAGAGLALSGVAVVIAASCLGYAKIQEPETKAAKLYMARMEKPVNVTVSGEVGIKDGQQVGLAKGGMVGVSPDATVRAVMPDAPRPSPAQIQSDARPASGAPVMTDVVKFSLVDYGKGQVVTGWRFGDSTQGKPVEQWCLYREREPDGAWRFVNIGEDGQPALPPRSPFPSVDLQGALASCVWAGVEASPARAPAQANPPRVISAAKS